MYSLDACNVMRHNPTAQRPHKHKDPTCWPKVRGIPETMVCRSSSLSGLLGSRPTRTPGLIELKDDKNTVGASITTDSLVPES